MTSDDSRRDVTESSEIDQGGLPEDAGNQMWDRSEWTGESESGRTDTPIVTDSPRRPTHRGDMGVPDLPGQADDGNTTGTTFGTGGDDKGM